MMTLDSFVVAFLCHAAMLEKLLHLYLPFFTLYDVRGRDELRAISKLWEYMPWAEHLVFPLAQAWKFLSCTESSSKLTESIWLRSACH